MDSFDHSLKSFFKTLKALDKELNRPPSWYYLNHVNDGYIRITTWATQERAQEIANNQEKPARVIPYKGRFAVQIYF